MGVCEQRPPPGQAVDVRGLDQGLAIAAKNPFAPSIWGYNDAIKPYEYNPEKAKEVKQIEVQ